MAIAGGGYHSLVLLTDGTVKVWGRNINGQLGDGSTIDRAVPVTVQGITNGGKEIYSSSGTFTSAALDSGEFGIREVELGGRSADRYSG